MLGEVELASLVATQVRRLLADGFARPTHLRTLLIGGGPIASDLIHSANRMDLPVVPTYGMTETAAVVASARVGDSHGRLYPLPGVEMSTAEDGRVLVRGEQVSPGYVDGPERADGEWFTTSDLGTFADDGSVEITGRADRVIITGGEKVEPELVEALLSRHPGVEEVAVVGITDRKWGETVVAYYAGDASPQDLDLVARAGLVPAAVPKRFIRVEHLPRTELGKVQLSALF
jgi:O-succinylbenzoic acid--CoA ligase